MAISITSDYAGTTQYEDILEGAVNAPEGVDMGAVVTGSYVPLSDKTLNTGRKNVYISHNNASKITDVKTFIAKIPTLSTYTYGGDDSAENDYNKLIDFGENSGTSKTNGDSNSSGLWIDMDQDSSVANQFDVLNYPDLVKIYGAKPVADNLGISFATAYILAKESMTKANGVNADTPVDGEIGESGNATLGDVACVKLRFYVKGNYAGNIGYFQIEWNLVYTETS